MRVPHLAAAATGPFRRHPFRLATAICLLACAGYAAAEPAWARHQIAISLTPQPTRYSEIFFSNLAAVPSRLVPGVTTKVPFAIINREGRTVRYTYSVVVTAPRVSSVAETGQVVIGNNEKADLIATFRPEEANALYDVRIRLARPHEAIEFHGQTG